MKIVLLAIDINEKTIMELATPFGLMYLSSYLKKYFEEDLEIQIFDGRTEPSYADADIVGISSMSQHYSRAIALARRIKETRGIPVIIGGPHISALPHTLDRSFDIGVIGEGEATLLELIRLWMEKGRFIPDELKEIQGIVYIDEGMPVMTPPRPLIKPVDEIPFPDRSLWNEEGHFFEIVSSRGCPFRCVFCAIAGSVYRQASPAYVLRELQEAWDTYKPPVIKFMDDLFTASTARLREISEGIQALGLHKKMAFCVSLRVDNLTEETMQLLKAMNVLNVFMGLESASPAILKYYKSDTITVSDIERALDLCAKYRIIPTSSFIIGAPRETPDDLYATYRFIVDNYTKKRLHATTVAILTPFPTSKVWHYAKERGLVSDDMDFSRLAMTLSEFNPYTYTYLNEVIPMEEFVDYVAMFEELHFLTNVRKYKRDFESFKDKECRIDRERLARFKEDVKRGAFVPPGVRP
jgi:anaerobic magnesium-protoporphyrin IX monomethyl ester cyclase